MSAKAGRFPWFYLLPTLAFLFMFTYLPMFHSVREGWRIVPEVMQRPDTLNSIRVTLTYMAIVVPGGVGLGLLSALAVNGQSRTRQVARAVLFYPVILPMVVFASIWLYLLNPTTGPMATFLSELVGRRVNLLNDPNLTIYTIAFVGILKDFGFYMLFFLAGLQSISRELTEAALIDGASRWTSFWKITFPLLGPTTFYVSVIALIWTIRQVDHLYILTPRGGVFGETELLLYRIYRIGFEYLDIPVASALSIVLFAFLVVTALVAIPRIEKGIYYGE
jgi:sn-glycerol 3-phosphate transport system permease protein